MPKPIRVGPSWTEVFLGALLSLALGIVLGAASLVLRPVLTVKELPKEADRQVGAVYYLEGSRDGNKGRLAETKRKDFAAGHSVAVSEDDLNLLATPKVAPTPPPAPKPKPGETPMPPMTADAKVMPPNFRVRDGVTQIAVATKISVMGFDQNVVLVAKGDFSREDGKFVFVPATMTLGSCPLERLPFARTLALKKLFQSQPFPEDVAASWGKLVAARAEGNELKLTLP
jgi:hypothetical protein